MYPSERDKEHFFGLLAKFNEDKASPEEVEFVERYLKILEQRPAHILNHHESEKETIGVELKDRLFKSIGKDNTQPTVHRVHFLRNRWQGWAAAAVIIMAVAGGYFFMKEDVQVKPSVVVAKVQADIKPGKEGAILTLSDGSQVVLDSMENGIVANQNGAVVRLNGSQLLYSGDGSVKAGKGGTAYNTISTPRGRQYKLVLPDGTNVWLNAASSLTFPTVFPGGERVVSVTGEAYFEVAKNKQAPFKVKLRNAAAIEVLGTRFNVNAYNDEASIKTTLTQGSVKVVNSTKAQLLVPGQQAQMMDKQALIKLVTDVNVSEVMAWKDGAFAFRNADLPAVMRELARWYDIEVEYQGAIPKAEFTGEIDKSLTLSQVLKGLSKTRINYKIENGNRLIILP